MTGGDYVCKEMITLQCVENSGPKHPWLFGMSPLLCECGIMAVKSTSLSLGNSWESPGSATDWLTTRGKSWTPL